MPIMDIKLSTKVTLSVKLLNLATCSAADVTNSIHWLVGSENFSVFGIDFEWKPRTKRISLMQLALEERVLLVQNPSELAEKGAYVAKKVLPLRTFLSNTENLFVGFNMMQDLTQLTNTIGDLWHCFNIFDLGRSYTKTCTHYAAVDGLKAFASSVLFSVHGEIYGEEFASDESAVTLSDWSRKQLSSKQILYAAKDAWLALELFLVLNDELQAMPELIPSPSDPPAVPLPLCAQDLKSRAVLLALAAASYETLPSAIVANSPDSVPLDYFCAHMESVKKAARGRLDVQSKRVLGRLEAEKMLIIQKGILKFQPKFHHALLQSITRTKAIENPLRSLYDNMKKEGHETFWICETCRITHSTKSSSLAEHEKTARHKVQMLRALLKLPLKDTALKVSPALDQLQNVSVKNGQKECKLVISICNDGEDDEVIELRDFAILQHQNTFRLVKGNYDAELQAGESLKLDIVIKAPSQKNVDSAILAFRCSSSCGDLSKAVAVPLGVHRVDPGVEHLKAVAPYQPMKVVAAKLPPVAFVVPKKSRKRKRKKKNAFTLPFYPMPNREGISKSRKQLYQFLKTADDQMSLLEDDYDANWGGVKLKDLKCDDITVRKALQGGIAAASYSTFWHVLLYFEEWRLELEMKKFDMKNREVKRQKGSGFFELEVPGHAVTGKLPVQRGDSISVYDNMIGYEGVVEAVEDGKVSLKLPDNFRGGKGHTVRFGMHRSQMRRMHLCLDVLSSLPIAVAEKLIGIVREPAGAGDDIGIECFNKHLNEYQKQAVARALRAESKIPYIIHGPPGTGKTTTLLELAQQCIASGRKVLVCTPSNAAADLFTTLLLQRGVKSQLVYRMNSFTRLARGISNEVMKELAKRSVVLTTMMNCTRLLYEGLNYGTKADLFDYIIIDEAGQASEPEVMIPISLFGPSAKKDVRIVLAGDHKQLGPIITEELCVRLGLHLSLLERLTSAPPYCAAKNDHSARHDVRLNSRFITMLRYNYRSHEELVVVPNSLFYSDQLLISANDLVAKSLLKWSSDWLKFHLKTQVHQGFPLIVDGVIGKDEREGRSPSYFNLAEISRVALYVKSLLDAHKNLKPSEIGVISPYAAQCRKLTQLISKLFPGVEVGTVEKFQGSEKRIIILSTVRSSNDYLEVDLGHHLGFVKNPKRFNVAITRAKALLVVVGNLAVLQTNNHWNALIEHARKNNSLIGEVPQQTSAAREDEELQRIEDALKFFDMLLLD